MINLINKIATEKGWKPLPFGIVNKTLADKNNPPERNLGESKENYKIRLIHYFRDDCNMRIDYAFKRSLKIIENEKD